MARPRQGWFGRLVNAEAGEAGAALAGFAFFFCLFGGYFMLRPLRETMGVTAGVDQLQWLFTATFVATLAAAPLFGLLGVRVPRARLVETVYGFFIANMLLFAVAFAGRADDVWIARTFYVWLSVYNLFAISLGWSLMADVFRVEQAKRLFAFIAAGASVGGLAGPLFGAALVGWLQPAGMMALAAVLLAATLPLKRRLSAWRALRGAGSGPAPDDVEADTAQRPLGGNPFSGFTRLCSSGYLAGMALFVVLLASCSTFLYLEQARLVSETFSTTEARVRVFSLLDFTVQSLAVLTQVFFTGRLARRLGVRFLLTAVPVMVAAGFLLLAVTPAFAVLAAVMVMRRAGEYALVRPGREMLFAAVDPDAKYKVKNVIDTLVYRGGDVVSSWLKAALDALAQSPAAVPLAGALCALAWGATGYWLGRRVDAASARDGDDRSD
jgi:AAA family ATP:ADP antiporter